MALNIPNIPAGNPQFKDVMDYFERLQERKQKQPLLDAQARQANAAAGREEQLANLPFAGRQMPGAAGRAVALMMVKSRYGEDSPEYKEAKDLYDLEKKRAEKTMEYQQFLIDSQEKRFASPTAKIAQEKQEVAQGFMPGTTVGNKPGKKLTNEQQQQLQGVYGLKQLSDITDNKVRERILYSKNMEKTLDNLPVDALVSYSGLKGTQDLIKDTISANTTGKITPRYQAYSEALTAAKTLAKQVRQFYGDSITAGVQQGLQELTNPTTWLKHPDIAKAQFNRFKKILLTEAKTFTDATKNANIFQEEDDNKKSKGKELTYNIETGEFE